MAVEETPLLSVVSPVYRAQETVAPLVAGLRRALDSTTQGSFEVILVEDASPDASWAAIVGEASRDQRIKGLRLSRNFGQHAAITAGLSHARGAFVAVMDCDLQDDPADVARLLARAREGYDVVFARRGRRAHSRLKSLTARIWGLLANWLAGRDVADPSIGAFSVLSRRTVAAFLSVGDVHRHYVMVVGWLGFPASHVDVVHRPRAAGKSGYSLRRLVRHSLDGVVSQSNRLLYAGLAVGFVYLGASVLGAVIIVVGYLARGFREGWASLAVLILLSTSVVLITLGIIGIYVGKVFDQARRRPLWLVRDSVNLGLGSPSERP